MKPHAFASCLAAKMVRFVDLKCWGGISRNRLEQKLGYFDRFLISNQFDSEQMNSQIIHMIFLMHLCILKISKRW